ncbi:hypothetical protein N9N67_05405 [Bacteriovoracaceae bacterium]|nr:hypothetical protein [Bacteriovoracaceae bacterium]
MRAFANKLNPEDRFLSNLELLFKDIFLSPDEKNQVKIKVDHLLEKAPLNSNIKLEIAKKQNSVGVNLILNCGGDFFTANAKESTWSTAFEAAAKKIEFQLQTWKKERNLSYIRVTNNSPLDV